MFEKIKRILAFIGVILLVGMYGATLVFALLDKPWANDCLKVSILLTIAVPVLLYTYIFIYKLFKK